LSERSLWNETLERGGKYYVERNGSSLIAFSVGETYKPGNGVAMIAGHIDAITARLKPISGKKTTAGYIQLGVAPYAGGLNPTWWDRDLSIGGKVLVKNSTTGKMYVPLLASSRSKTTPRLSTGSSSSLISSQPLSEELTKTSYLVAVLTISSVLTLQWKVSLPRPA
jgi:hypothetical protein